MIDAHVQYNGGWKTYLTLQPGLACEFEDHRTCKEASERLQAVEDAKDQEVKDAEAAAAKEAVAAAAVTAEADAKQAEINEAGRKKHEAARIVNKNAADKLEAAQATASRDIGNVKAKAAADVEEIEKATAAEIAKIIEDQKAAIEKINAVDWLSEVRKPKA